MSGVWMVMSCENLCVAVQKDACECVCIYVWSNRCRGASILSDFMVVLWTLTTLHTSFLSHELADNQNVFCSVLWVLINPRPIEWKQNHLSLKFSNGNTSFPELKKLINSWDSVVLYIYILFLFVWPERFQQKKNKFGKGQWLFQEILEMRLQAKWGLTAPTCSLCHRPNMATQSPDNFDTHTHTHTDGKTHPENNRRWNESANNHITSPWKTNI